MKDKKSAAAEESEGLQGRATDFVKKVLTVGVGAVFLTEESLRSVIGDLKLPKELLGGLLDSAQKTKSEFFQGLSQELVSQILNRVDPKELIEETLKNYEVKVTVKFEPKEK